MINSNFKNIIFGMDNISYESTKVGETTSSDISSELLVPEFDVLGKKENIIKLCIYNINGNSNEFALTPPKIVCSEGTLDDIKHEEVHRIVSMLKNISSEELKGIPEINIPIYIFNIYNTLTNGNKNEINY